MQRDDAETVELLERVRAGDGRALEELMGRHRPLLRRFVEVRLDPRLRSRVDASDVVQEAHLEAARRIHEFLDRRPMPFRLWLQRTAYENLVRLRRTHVNADRRSVARETSLPDSSSLLLVRKLFDREENWPGRRLLTEEIQRRVREALGQLEDIDQEILLLRSFEGLENDEIAQVLGLEPGTTSKRYGRALLRLRKVLVSHQEPGSAS